VGARVRFSSTQLGMPPSNAAFIDFELPVENVEYLSITYDREVRAGFWDRYLVAHEQRADARVRAGQPADDASSTTSQQVVDGATSGARSTLAFLDATSWPALLTTPAAAQ